MNLTVSFFVNGHLRETKQVTTPCTIGRSRQANWVLLHPMLSRNHCILFDKGEELFLSDDGSLNGTHFKGLPVKDAVRLQFGDEFGVGHDLKFKVSAPVESATDRLDYDEQTTTINTKDELLADNLGQSTLLVEDPSAEDA
jgi:pSer/pThr/pTyr-binding forkhead associated (FHA) protein